MAALSTFIGLCELVVTFTPWFDKNTRVNIFIVYIGISIFLILLGIVINNYILTYKVKKLKLIKNNQDGLIQQFENDKEEKKSLRNDIESLRSMLNLTLNLMSKEEVETFNSKLKAKERMDKIERNSRDKDN
ncbi:hypothetical protein [Lactobacillus johnsonii]|uniref:hypothetical protein n=1 Tax=Lactobacillus johnsonii TaxID=33959 RepID=UPI001100514B|nr:hypothetical protein [Lactobacillus johnsonii]TGA95004.1 hypothetical protein E5F86_02645 [Lactobacillus johnsonii]